MRKDDRRIRVVVDTNLCISMLIGKRMAELRPLFALPQYELAVSDTLLDEIRLVTARPKFAPYFNPADIEDFLNFLTDVSTFFKLDSIPRRCRDPKDDFLLELAIVADADILLSGDSDLTDMKRIGHCRIMTATEFLQTYAE